MLERLVLVSDYDLLEDVHHSFEILDRDLELTAVKELQILVSDFVVQLEEGKILIAVENWLHELDIVVGQFEGLLILQKGTRNY